MEIVLVRHSLTQGNIERRFTGLSDIPILPEGVKIAEEIAPTLPKVERVYCSPLLRCRQTAAILFGETETEIVEDLHETDFGPFEGKNHEELKDNPHYLQWLQDGDFQEDSGGESIAHVIQRMKAAVTYVIEDAEKRGLRRVAIMSHGGTIMALMTTCGAPSRESFYDWKPENASGWLLAVEAGDPFTLRIKEPVGRNKA